MKTQVKKIQNFIFEQQRKKNSLILFHQALFAPKTLLYVIFRIRYFIISSIFNMLLHIGEFYILTIVFSIQHLKSALFLRALSFFIEPFWWGVLELLRERIRNFHYTKNNKLLAKELGYWYMLTIIISGIFFCISIVFLLLAFKSSGDESLFDTLFAAIFFQIGLGFLINTYRAGIYSLYRIYRPLFSILLPSLIGISTLFFLWKIFGSYALTINIVVISILNASLSSYYISRAYKFYQLAQPIWPNLKNFFKFTKTLVTPEFFLASSANFFIGIEALIIWLVLYFYNVEKQSGIFFLIFYFINPLFQAASHWARLFYFDIKKYDNNLLRDFMVIFHKKVFYIAPVIGGFFWLIATIFSLGYFHKEAYLFSVISSGIFVLHSTIAYLQIIAFGNRRYLDVIISGLIFLGCLIPFIKNQSMFIQFLCLFSLLIARFFYLLFPRTKPLVHANHLLQQSSYVHWLQSLKKWQPNTTNFNDQKIRIFYVELFSDVNIKQKIELTTYISSKSSVKYNYFWLNSSILIGFTSSDEDEINNIFLYASSIIKKYQVSSSYQNGESVLNSKSILHFLYPEHIRKTQNEIPMIENFDDMLKKFKALFPQGTYWFTDKPRLSNFLEQFYHNDASLYRDFFHQLCKTLCSPLEHKKNSNFDVSVFYPSKHLPIIFLIPISIENKHKIFSWHDTVYLCTLKQFCP